MLKPGGVILDFNADYGLSDFADTSALPKEHGRELNYTEVLLI